MMSISKSNRQFNYMEHTFPKDCCHIAFFFGGFFVPFFICLFGGFCGVFCGVLGFFLLCVVPPSLQYSSLLKTLLNKQMVLQSITVLPYMT